MMNQNQNQIMNQNQNQMMNNNKCSNGSQPVMLQANSDWSQIDPMNQVNPQALNGSQFDFLDNM